MRDISVESVSCVVDMVGCSSSTEVLYPKGCVSLTNIRTSFFSVYHYMNIVLVIAISILVVLGIFALGVIILMRALWKYDDQVEKEEFPTSHVKPTSKVIPTSNVKPTSKVIPTSNVKPTSKVILTSSVKPPSKVIPTSNVNPGFVLNSGHGDHGDCLTIPTDPSDMEIKLSSCDLSKKGLQSFVYDEAGRRISPVDYPNMCLGFNQFKGIGNEDPNMTIPLELQQCDSSYPQMAAQQINWDGSSLSKVGGPVEVEMGAMRLHANPKVCVMAHGATSVGVGNCTESDSSRFSKIPIDYFEAHIDDPHP